MQLHRQMSRCVLELEQSLKNDQAHHCEEIMTETLVGTYLIRNPGGKLIQAISPIEAEKILGAQPSEQVMAAASTVIDQLEIMENSFLISLRGRSFSRTIRFTLEYYKIYGHDLQVLILLLAHYQYARPFFNLATPGNNDGLKEYLIDAEVLWEQILYYYEFSVWDPVRFTGGFLRGIVYSAAAILEALKDLFDFVVEAFNDSKTAIKKIKELINGLRQLTLESMVAMAKDEWIKWQKEFSAALFELDFEKAGFKLGKLAADIWFLLTGIRALAKLPGFTLEVARKFGVLFLKGARYSRQALSMLITFIQKIASLIKEASQIGYRALTNFVQDISIFTEKITEGALIIMDHTGMMLINIPQSGLVFEGIGSLPEGFLLAQMDQGVTNVLASVRVEFEKGIKYVNDLKISASRKVKKVENPKQFISEIKVAEELSNQLVKLWRDTLQKIFSENKIPLMSHELGSWTHDNLEAPLKELAAALSKTYKSIPEIQIRKLANQLASDQAELKLFLKRSNVHLLDFAKNWPGMYEALGVSDEKELVKFLKKMGYTDPTKTRIGALISDGVLYNEETKRLISIDWTSGLGKYIFANQFEVAMKSGESLSTAQKLELAKRYLKHTFREYALREAILEHIFEGWYTKIIEVMYEPFRLPK